MSIQLMEYHRTTPFKQVIRKVSAPGCRRDGRPRLVPNSRAKTSRRYDAAGGGGVCGGTCSQA